MTSFPLSVPSQGYHISGKEVEVRDSGSQHNQLCCCHDLQLIQNHVAPSQGPPARVLSCSPISDSSHNWLHLLTFPYFYHSNIPIAFLVCHSKSTQAWPHGMEQIISNFSLMCCNQGELPPSYILGGSHSHLPGSKRGHSYFTYPWNQLKVINMLNDHSRGYLQNCC